MEGLYGPYGRLVFILAGYKANMEKMFEHNTGLPSRFPRRFHFHDYTDVELLKILKHYMTHEASPLHEAGKAAESRTASSSSARGANASSRGTRTGAFPFGATFESAAPGMKRDDRFGHEWTCGGSTRGGSPYATYMSTTVPGSQWTDAFGNNAGYGPASVGRDENPLVDADGNEWVFDDAASAWNCRNTGKRQAHYPGTPAPPQSAGQRRRKMPFVFMDGDEKWARIAIRRLGRGRHRPGFGNARAVRAFFDTSRDRQAKRVTVARRGGEKVNVMALTRDDLLGPPVTRDMLTQCDEWKEFMAMTGLQPVKDAMGDLVSLVLENARLEEEEKPIQEVVLNRLFLGNPGTGKTTVAKLYGKILARLGLLSKGELVFKTASDFKGDVVGSSETTTRGILHAAEGNVLVIDEAYALVGTAATTGEASGADLYGMAVIDTLVEQVQGRPGDDRAVLLLGYQKEMENMLKVANPGLSRRFQQENAFVFPDYSDKDLIRILFKKVENADLTVDLSTAKAAVRTLAKARAKPHFGNAGAVDNMLSQAKLRRTTRQSQGGNLRESRLTVEDFGAENVGKTDDDTLHQLMEEMAPCGELKKEMQNIWKMVKRTQDRGHDPKDGVSYAWLFLGSPGTGKTTMARKMGEFYHALGLLPSAEVKEVSPQDMVTGYLGQAGKKTRDVFENVSCGLVGWVGCHGRLFGELASSARSACLPLLSVA